MKGLLSLLFALLLSLCAAQSAEPEELNPDPLTLDNWSAQAVAASGNSTAASKTQALLVPHDRTRVAVLGYHNFSNTKPVTEMCMRTSEFREQMETIRRYGYTVISMQEFLEWRFGARELPEKCVLITLDDGWKSVYTDAFPILKEYGYPFHLFLYTTYVNGRGDSMSPAQIKEMMAAGASIGSHSTSHYYPKTWKQCEARGEEEYAKLIEVELGDSFRKLSQLFGPINTYCYPGGYITQPMLDNLPGYGYIAAFTVVPGKVTDKEDPFRIHRYMVFGTDPGVFANAMDFRTAASGKNVSAGKEPGTLPTATPLPPFSVSPKPNETVGYDVPAITAYMGELGDVDLSSVRMAISGFGRVPAKVDENTRTVQWTPPMRLYMPHLSAHVTWNSTDGTAHKAEWSFAIDPNTSAPNQPQ